MWAVNSVAADNTGDLSTPCGRLRWQGEELGERKKEKVKKASFIEVNVGIAYKG